MENTRELYENLIWEHLDQRNRDWIRQITREAQAEYVRHNGALPTGQVGRQHIVNVVMEQAAKRDIELPRAVLVKHIFRELEAANRQSPPAIHK